MACWAARLPLPHGALGGTAYVEVVAPPFMPFACLACEPARPVLAPPIGEGAVASAFPA